MWLGCKQVMTQVPGFLLTYVGDPAGVPDSGLWPGIWGVDKQVEDRCVSAFTFQTIVKYLFRIGRVISFFSRVWDKGL